MSYRPFLMTLIFISITAEAQLHPIATNVGSLSDEGREKVLSNFNMNKNSCLLATSASETCMRFKNSLSGRKFDESVTLPNDWGNSIQERRRVAEETYKMEFSPSFGYRVKSCFGFCAGEEKKQDSLSVVDGPRNQKEFSPPHDTIGDSERGFYDSNEKPVSKNVQK